MTAIVLPFTFANAPAPTPPQAATPTANFDGDFSTIAAYLNNPVNRISFALDTGATNALVVNPDPPITSLATPFIIWTIPKNTNNSAASLNASSTGAKNVVQDTLAGSSSLIANEIVANEARGFLWDPAISSYHLLNSGTRFKGSVNTMNPYSASASQSAAHLLTVLPTECIWYLQCLSTELGYAVGERVYGGMVFDGSAASASGFTVSADATNTYINTSANTPLLVNKSTFAVTAITAAKWELVIQPFL